MKNLNIESTSPRHPKTWSIPVTWEVYGEVKVEAETLAEAMKMVEIDIDHNGQAFSLPTDNEYVDGSFRPSEDEESIVMLYQK